MKNEDAFRHTHTRGTHPNKALETDEKYICIWTETNLNAVWKANLLTSAVFQCMWVYLFLYKTGMKWADKICFHRTSFQMGYKKWFFSSDSIILLGITHKKCTVSLFHWRVTLLSDDLLFGWKHHILAQSLSIWRATVIVCY